MSAKPEPLSAEEIAGIAAALEGITPLPWTADEPNLFIRAKNDQVMVADDGWPDVEKDQTIVTRIRGFGSGQPQGRNLHAIATVMNAAPRLLAAIADLQARALDEASAWDSNLGEDGELFLSLDSSRLHFEIEVKPDGQAEWFFRNRAADESEGNADVDFLPERMAARYREVLAAIREEIARRKGTT